MTIKLWFEEFGFCFSENKQCRTHDLQLTGDLVCENGEYHVTTNAEPAVDWHWPIEQVNCVQTSM